MRYLSFIIFVVVLVLSGGVFAAGTDSTSTDQGARQGCRVIDVHCLCTNPSRNFVVENQKLGRSNPGEPGECKLKPEIDSQAGKMPIAYCLGSASVKDERLGESKCTATWTCEEACILK
jgi:hypothetical protein